MTDKEVIKKAIEIALENNMPARILDENVFYNVYFSKTRYGTRIIQDKDNLEVEKCYGLLFSHHFAKAFWGEKQMHIIFPEPNVMSHEPLWHHRLKEMVLYENPIDYLRNFIYEEKSTKTS